MNYTLGLLVLLATAFQCECSLSLLGGILSTAHEQVHEVAGAVLGTISKGINLNFESHLGFNQRRPGYEYGPPQGPPNEYGPPHNNNYGPPNEFRQPPNNNYEPPNEFHPPSYNNYGPPNEFRPPHYNNGRPNEFGPPNNNYEQRPSHNGYQYSNENKQNGYKPNQNNLNNQQYTNENNRYPINPNNNYQDYNNGNGYNQGYPDQQNQGYDNNQQGHNENQLNNNGHNYNYNQNRPNYGNTPLNVNPNNLFNNPNESDNLNPQDNLINGNKPVIGYPDNGFGTIYGDNNQDFVPSSPQPEFSTSTINVIESDNQTVDETTTDKPKEDTPIFIPLGDYIYSGEAAANITAPKRETDKKNQEAEEEDFAIDIRFKDE